MKKIRVELSDENLTYINNNDLSITKTLNYLVEKILREDAPEEVEYVKKQIIELSKSPPKAVHHNSNKQKEV